MPVRTACPILIFSLTVLHCVPSWATSNTPKAAPADPQLISVQFLEGAPKDRFTLINESNCTFTNALITIDLADTVGKLIFDTTSEGAGVDVFQPFEVVSGGATLVGSASVRDGDHSLSLHVNRFTSGETVAFTIDLDDTLVRSDLGQIRVANSEINGAVVTLSADSITPIQAIFSANAATVLDVMSCL